VYSSVVEQLIAAQQVGGSNPPAPLIPFASLCLVSQVFGVSEAGCLCVCCVCACVRACVCVRVRVHVPRCVNDLSIGNWQNELPERDSNSQPTG
jgi:hypothetical protein